MLYILNQKMACIVGDAVGKSNVSPKIRKGLQNLQPLNRCQNSECRATSYAFKPVSNPSISSLCLRSCSTFLFDAEIISHTLFD